MWKLQMENWVKTGRGTAYRPDFRLSQVPLWSVERSTLNSEHGYVLLVSQQLGLSHSCSSPLQQRLFSFPCWARGWWGGFHSAVQAQLLTGLSVMLIQIERKNPETKQSQKHFPCTHPLSPMTWACFRVWLLHEAVESWQPLGQQPSGSGDEKL